MQTDFECGHILYMYDVIAYYDVILYYPSCKEVDKLHIACLFIVFKCHTVLVLLLSVMYKHTMLATLHQSSSF